MVALFEAAKGALVLAAGAGLLSLLGRDLERSASDLVQWMHFNPAHHYPKIFIRAVSRLTDIHLWWLAAGALAYATIRFVEAGGLWHNRTWAAWLGAVSGSIYLPIEIAEMTQKVTWLRVGVFLINAAVVAVLVLSLWQHRKKNARGR